MSKELEFVEFLISASESEKHFINLANYDIRLMLLKIKEKIQCLESIDNANPSEALEYIENKLKDLEYVAKQNNNEYLLSKYIPSEKFSTIKQALIKAQENEKENELLKEIIKSLFDGGCPLHQYVDDKFGLTIEVDNECSIMHLGEFKGVNLDEFLKEVLNNE